MQGFQGVWLKQVKQAARACVVYGAFGDQGSALTGLVSSFGSFGPKVVPWAPHLALFSEASWELPAMPGTGAAVEREAFLASASCAFARNLSERLKLVALADLRVARKQDRARPRLFSKSQSLLAFEGSAFARCWSRFPHPLVLAYRSPPPGASQDSTSPQPSVSR